MASPLGALSGSGRQRLPYGSSAGSPLQPAGRGGPAHSLSTVSQDGSASQQPQQKRLKLDTARLSYEKQLRRQAATLLESQTQVSRLQTKLQVRLPYSSSNDGLLYTPKKLLVEEYEEHGILFFNINRKLKSNLHC